MHSIKAAAITCLAAVTLSAQSETQTDLQTLTQSVRALRRTSTASEAVKAQADRLLAEANATPLRSEARRKMASAAVLLKGEEWDERREFHWSLALRPDSVVADSTLPFVVRLSQTYPAILRSDGNVMVKLSLRQKDREARPVGSFELIGADLIEQPFGVDCDLRGAADGAYDLQAEILDRGGTIASASVPVQLVKGIRGDRADLERRLSRVLGHDATKASIRYSYLLAETVNTGRRRLIEADFGIPFQPQLPFDFQAGLARSAILLKALEAGKDPLIRAKGDSERHYWFEEAREMMAYHVYAPRKWDGKSKLPMVFVLHGNTRDHNFYFDRVWLLWNDAQGV